MVLVQASLPALSEHLYSICRTVNLFLVRGRAKREREREREGRGGGGGEEDEQRSCIQSNCYTSMNQKVLFFCAEQVACNTNTPSSGFGESQLVSNLSIQMQGWKIHFVAFSDFFLARITSDFTRSKVPCCPKSPVVHDDPFGQQWTDLPVFLQYESIDQAKRQTTFFLHSFHINFDLN